MLFAVFIYFTVDSVAMVKYSKDRVATHYWVTTASCNGKNSGDRVATSD